MDNVYSFYITRKYTIHNGFQYTHLSLLKSLKHESLVLRVGDIIAQKHHLFQFCSGGGYRWVFNTKAAHYITSEDLVPRYSPPSSLASTTISLNSAFFGKIVDLKQIRKAALEKFEECKQKIALGGALYKILDEGVVEEESFTTDWKEALDVNMKKDCENVV